MNKINALKLKADLQKQLKSKMKSMPSNMSEVDKIHKIATSGKLGKWWSSLPTK
jgi:hypothetical protein